MEIKRKSFQGVSNIIKFNWHLYLIILIILILLFIFSFAIKNEFNNVFTISFIFGLITILNSLFISYLIYDFSDLYKLNWLPNTNNKKTLNINAGFDETSQIIIDKFPKTELIICDFYDPKKHTELSIKRARKAYPNSQSCLKIQTNYLPFDDNSFDYVLATFSIHEIRNDEEKIQLLKEIQRIIKPNGEIFITEHLRDLKNFFFFNVGAYHFHSKKNWLNSFKKSNINLKTELKNYFLISTFILKKDA